VYQVSASAFRFGGLPSRFAVGVLAAVAVEAVNAGIGRLTPVPTLEPLPVVAMLAGVLLGGGGVAGCLVGQVAFRLWHYDPMGWIREPDLVYAGAFDQYAGIPLAYALLGAVGYLVFRLSPEVGRGFPDTRSYTALAVTGAAGGALTALAINLLFGPSMKGFLVHSASNFVSVLLVCPPLMLLADRFLRPLMVKIPGERLLAIPFPDNLDLRDGGEDLGASRGLRVRLALLCGLILAITVLVLALADRTPQLGGWPLLGYLGPVVWTAMNHGMRGGLLATSLSGTLYLIGRAWVDRDLLPDDPDLYAAGLYADFVVFSLVAVFLGSEREEEIRLRDKLALRARQITTLNEMGDLLQAAVHFDEAYEVVNHGIRRLFPHDPGALAMLGESSHLLEVVVDWGEEGSQSQGVFRPEDCWALRRGDVHYVEDSSTAPVCRHLRSEAIKSYLCVPLMAHGETLGVLHIERGPRRRGAPSRELDDARRELAVTTGKEIGLALGNLRLRESLRAQSIRDPLTGLFNRRYMAETLERERYRARRQELSFGVIMIDIDHFKRFNDRHGHEAGDLVLQEVGKFLQTRARREDIVCRYGGEEFVIVLSEASLEVTCRRARELCEEIKQLRLRHGGQVLETLSMSFGVAAFPDHGKTEKDILRAADTALYRAKAAGRERVEVAEPLG
jgi:diguanylate cyclase (GGDEF)-like protein